MAPYSNTFERGAKVQWPGRSGQLAEVAEAREQIASLQREPGPVLVKVAFERGSVADLADPEWLLWDPRGASGRGGTAHRFERPTRA